MDATGICRFCHATCGLKVTIEDGRVTRLIGDLENPAYHGYSCVKGRSFHHFHQDPARVLRPLHRDVGGALQAVDSTTALHEAGDALSRVIAVHGPRAVAMYSGTFSHFCPAGVMLRDAFMDAIGSPLRFSNATIDQPGKPISMALHGRWGAGPQAFADANVCLLVGANTLVSMWGGIPPFNPARRLHEARKRGLKLIVIDPRRTETARKADLHLQCRPGQDVPLLAAMLNVIFAEGLQDREFVAAETEGAAALQAAVAPFTPARVAPQAGVPAAQITEAARLFARAARGNATSGTGPSMAPHGVLMDYLVLALNTVCGRWVRAGEPIPNRGVLFRQHSGIARAEKPRPAAGFGERLRVRGLGDTAAGLPSGALADEILTPGEGQVRALIVVGGNPLTSWPNAAKTRRALESLELLIVVDPMLSATARLAHFVFGPRFGFETPALTFANEGISVYGLSIGYQEPFAQFQPVLVEPPAGSDVLEDWRIFHGLAQAMGLSLAWRGEPIDMVHPPTTEQLLEKFLARSRSRVTLEALKAHPHGALFPDPQPLAEPRTADWPHRLRLADPAMLAELGVVEMALEGGEGASATAILGATDTSGQGARCEELALLLVSRREHATYNSVGHGLAALRRKRPFNPAYLNLADARRLGVDSGMVIEIASGAGRVRAVAEPADDIREGVVSLAHGFEAGQGDPRAANAAMLVDDAEGSDPLSGLPRMSAIPVRVRKI